MVFLVSACIVLYRHRKYGHHLGTKVSEIIAFISVLMGDEACICKWFHNSKLFNKKIKYYFLWPPSIKPHPLAPECTGKFKQAVKDGPKTQCRHLQKRETAKAKPAQASAAVKTFFSFPAVRIGQLRTAPKRPGDSHKNAAPLPGTATALGMLFKRFAATP